MKKFLEIFLIFLKIGAFTIGGGYAMLPLIQVEVVDKKEWLSTDEFMDMLAVIQSAPGLISINSAIFIGYKIGGITGAIIAAIGVILPSFTIILVIAFLLSNIGDNMLISKAFTGVRAGVVALIGTAAFKLAKTAVRGKFGTLIAIIAFIAMVFFDVHAVLVIITGGLIGFIAYKVKGKGQSQ